MDETSIYLTGLVFPGPGGAYDPTQPQKAWALPQSAWPSGVNSASTFIGVGIDPYNCKQIPITGTYAWAAAANVAATNPTTGLTNPTEVNMNVVPIPVDLTKIPAGFELQADPLAPFGKLPDIVADPAAAPITPTGTTIAPTEDPNLVRLINGENEILVRLGLPTV